MNNNVPQMSGMPQVILNEGDQAAQPIAAENAMTQNDVRLSKNDKLAMAYKGVKEIEQTWKTEPSYEEVDGTIQFVDKDLRPDPAVATGDDGLVFDNGSSSSANDGLVGPDCPAIAEDRKDAIILDMPGKIGGPGMTDENYLSLPGYPVVTSATSIGAFAVIQAYAIADNASSLTIAELIAAGVPNDMLKTSKLANYKSAIAGATTIDTIQDLVQIIFDVNEA